MIPMIKTGTYNDKNEKWCNNCRKYQPVSDFGNNRVSKDGLNWSCAQSLKDATNKIRKNFVRVTSKPAQEDDAGGACNSIESATKCLKALHPKMKLANPYEYGRPDAYDNYIQELKSQSMTELKNVKRTPEYIKLLHSINSCTNALQLKQIKESVLSYHKGKKQDSGELLSEYVQQEEILSVD